MSYFTTESLGPQQELTPEGFLLCRNVPIARTGSQRYSPREIPLVPGRDGIITIDRDEKEVFSERTMSSFNGKPVVDEHPAEGKITPLLWKKHSVGVVLNPRRGDGKYFDDSFLFADLLIKHPSAIKAIREGKREVSAGYDAEYEQISPGRGRQLNIVGNHVALVDKGRCGPSCAIGDSEGDSDMSNRAKMFRDRLKKAIRTKDTRAVFDEIGKLIEENEDTIKEIVADEEMSVGTPGGGHITINVNGGGSGGKAPDVRIDDADEGEVTPPPEPSAAAEEAMPSWAAAVVERLDQLEKIVAMLAEGEAGEEGQEEAVAEAENIDPEEVKDRKPSFSRDSVKGNSAALQTDFQRVLSQAEVLMPGIQFPTFDSASPTKTTLDSMCSFRRKTLDAAKGTDKGKEAIKLAMGGGALPKTFHDVKMTCDAVSTIFNAASALAGAQNTGRATQPHFGPDGKRNGFSAKPLTAAEINKRNHEFYAKQQ